MQHTCACSNANGPHPTAQRAFYAHLKQPPTCSSRHHSPLLFFPRATAHTCKIRCTSASVIGPRGVHSHQCFVHRIARQGMCGSAPIDKAAPSHSAASANIRIVRPLNLVGSKKGSNVRLYLERVLHKNGFGQRTGRSLGMDMRRGLLAAEANLTPLHSHPYRSASILLSALVVVVASCFKAP